MKLYFALLLVLTLLFTACGGGSTSTEPTTKTSKLIDASVTGVSYACTGFSGLTDDGDFNYASTCGSISFNIGGVTLPSIEATALASDGELFISELAGKSRSNSTDAVVVNILRFLQSIDDDNNPSNGIVITQAVRDALASLTLDLSDSSVTEAELLALLTSIGKTLVSKAVAVAHFEETLGAAGISVDTLAPNTPTVNSSKATQSNQNSVSVEISGEVDSDIYVNGTKVLSIGSTGTESITLSLAGDDGSKNFSISLKDAKGNESEALSFSIDKDATAPSFSLSDVTVAENQTTAFTVIATDAHALTYALGGLDKAKFNLSSTGVVTFKTAPNYEEVTERSFVLSITVTDSFGNEKSESLTLSVSNVAEFKPVLNAGLITVDVNTVGGSVLSNRLNIANTGDTAISSIVLTGNIANRFEVANNGQLTLKTNVTLIDAGGIHVLTAVATNAAGSSVPMEYTFNVDGIVPAVPILTAFTANIAENVSIGTTVGTVLKSSQGSSPVTAFTLSDSTNFEINTAGVIITKTLLDFETTPSYTLSVTATNTAGESTSVSVNITVTDVAEQTLTLLKTGQTTQYEVFDDAYYEKGLERSYTRDASKEVVSDNATGLLWQDDNDAKSITKNHADAITYCTDLTLGGFSTWRLPSIEELVYLTDKGRTNPALDPTFENVISDYYWSASTYASDTSLAWVVYFGNGNGTNYAKSNSNYVRCVRGGQ